MSRNIIAAGDGAVAAPPAALSKRARKRLAKAEAFREKKRLKKERKKEARSLLAQHRQAGAPNAATAGLSPPLTASANPAFGNQQQQPTGVAKLARQARERDRRARFLDTCARGPRIVFDMDFEEALTLKEKKSMSQQIMYCYGANKRAKVPVAMHLAGLRGDTEGMLKKIHGFPDRWLGVTVSPKPYDLDPALYADLSLIHI